MTSLDIVTTAPLLAIALYLWSRALLEEWRYERRFCVVCALAVIAMLAAAIKFALAIVGTSSVS